MTAPGYPEHPDKSLEQLTEEGGVAFIDFLIINQVMNYQFKDIAHLPEEECKGWIDAMLKELHSRKEMYMKSLIFLKVQKQSKTNGFMM